MEVWLHSFSFPGAVAERARQAEDWGFTGLLLADSQNLNADIWVELALAGAATSHLRVAREAAPAGQLTIGAYLNVAVHPDRDAARELVRGSTAIFARFATEGAPTSGLSEVTRRGIERLASGYDKDRHGEGGAAYAQLLDGEFIDRFAVAGTAANVRDRLTAIADAGVQRLIVVPGSLDADPAAVEESNMRFASDVLPALIR